jgi:hypothetical protein
MILTAGVRRLIAGPEAWLGQPLQNTRRRKGQAYMTEQLARAQLSSPRDSFLRLSNTIVYRSRLHQFDTYRTGCQMDQTDSYGSGVFTGSAPDPIYRLC